jgi:hypothetical protein
MDTGDVVCLPRDPRAQRCTMYVRRGRGSLRLAPVASIDVRVGSDSARGSLTQRE